MPVSRLVLAAALLSLPLAHPASAAWPHDPASGGVPVCAATGNQTNAIILPDGAGGAFVAWQDARADGGDVYAQHLSAQGVPVWEANGVAVCSAAGIQQGIVMVADDAGGIILAWRDPRSGPNDVYAQRIDATGAPAWTSNGVVVCDAANHQLNVAITTDGAGGAIVGWQDLRSGINYDGYVQRLDGTGVALWTANGVLVTAASGSESYLALTPDGSGGAIVAWQDSRVVPNDLYARRVDATGAPLWTTDGVAVCTAAGSQTEPRLLSDGYGGAYVVWVDTRTGSGDVYAQWLNASGSPQWATDGTPVCTATGDQILPSMISDGGGGLLLAWSDYRGGAAYDIYAQWVGASGVGQWATNGVALCTATGGQIYPSVVPDGAGGAIVAWQDGRSVGSDDLYAQRISRAGVPQWAADGVPLCTAAGYQQIPRLAVDAAGSAVAVWFDHRNGVHDDLYAQRIDRYGYLGVVAPAIGSVRDVSNDQGGQVKVSWDASYPDLLGDPNVAMYDVWRSVPSAVALARLARGTRMVSTLADAYVEPGATLLSASGYAWEHVSTQPAFHYVPTYSLVAATEGDSIAGSNPLTVFMVVARNAANTMFWMSAPDSGYSVDDLAPPAPAPFTGTYSASGTAMTWQASAAADFAGYRLYRGGNAGFVPGPANLIAALPGTAYLDAAGQPYWYKLTAVDVHGNESPPSALLPSGSLAVEGASPDVLALSSPQPNPACLRTTLRFALPRAGAVRLALFDASGRRVRTLVDGAREAGEHAVAWDLRDDAGRAVGAGLYFATLEADGARLTRRVMAVR